MKAYFLTRVVLIEISHTSDTIVQDIFNLFFHFNSQNVIYKSLLVND